VTLEELAIPGVFALELEPVHDGRGFFARTYARADLAACRASIAEPLSVEIGAGTLYNTPAPTPGRHPRASAPWATRRRWFSTSSAPTSAR